MKIIIQIFKKTDQTIQFLVGILSLICVGCLYHYFNHNMQLFKMHVFHHIHHNLDFDKHLYQQFYAVPPKF